MKHTPKERKSAGGVVISRTGKVLVVSQKGISWSLPKGGIDPGEVPLIAARREIYEESGLQDLTLLKELGSYWRYRIGKDGKEDQSERKTITIFLFKTAEEHLKPVDPHNPEARWVEKDEVADLLTYPKDKEFFLRFKDEI